MARVTVHTLREVATHCAAPDLAQPACRQNWHSPLLHPRRVQLGAHGGFPASHENRRKYLSFLRLKSALFFVASFSIRSPPLYPFVLRALDARWPAHNCSGLTRRRS
jgi:hypothetical protein